MPTTKLLNESGVSRRDMIRIGAGGLGFGLFGGLGPVPVRAGPGEPGVGVPARPARSSWSSSGSAATTG